MLKSTAYSIATPLCHIFNLSISTGLVPLEWKSSFIVPIPKTSPASSSPSNYRPISLLCLVSKLLEKHIHSFLSDFCISHHLISPHQYGFLPRRSTASALLYSTHSILSLLESHLSVCGVFLDLKKAFDSVPHLPLLDLLASLNLPPHLLNWLHSYLINRTQRVVIKGSTSPPCPVSSGVPQGSILGPLLFIIYINGLTDLPLSPSTQFVLYADDIFLFSPINSPSDMQNLQSDLDAISHWLSSHHLHLNSSKSKFMFFSRKPVSHFDHFPTLSISHSPLDSVSSFRYLGVLLTPSSPGLTTSLLSAQKLANYLDSSSVTSTLTPPLLHSSSSIIISLVRPHLEYCSLIWDPSSPTLIRSLESVQLFALKLASKFRPFLIPSLKSQFNLPSLASRRSYFKLIFLFKLYHELLHFPSPILQFNPTLPYPIRSFHPNNFLCPPSKTSSFQKSFFPSAISLWNTLPPAPKETQSLSFLKSTLKDILFKP